MLGFFVVALDAQIVNVALPRIGADLGAGISGLQWVVTGYTLTFSALILFAGTLSDRAGARRAYGAGMVLFAASSALYGLAPSLGVLIAARLLQGAGAAMVTPTSLALIREGFHDAEQRTRAIALWAVGGSVAAAAGPIVGDALAVLHWRLIFLINLPVAALAMALLAKVERSTRRETPFDYTGQSTAVIALGAFSYVVIEGGNRGWGSPLILELVALGALSLIGFLVAQARGPHPMIPLALFGSRQVSVALAIALTSMAAFYGVVFVQSLYFQQQRGESALGTGLLFLPMTALVTVFSSRAAWLVARFRSRALIATGLLVQCAGLVVIAAMPATVPIWLASAVMVSVGVGGSLTVPPIASLVIDNAPAALAGTTSGVLNTFRQLGGSLGVAVIGAVIAAHATFLSGLRVGLVAAALVLWVTAALSFTLQQQQQTTD